MRLVKLLKRYGNLNPDEVGGYDDHVAKVLVDGKVGVYCDEQAEEEEAAAVLSANPMTALELAVEKEDHNGLGAALAELGHAVPKSKADRLDLAAEVLEEDADGDDEDDDDDTSDDDDETDEE